ncbi:MAG: flagellar export chaperone FliS [Candidatus Zixiibacteriota bacterium]
MSNNVNAYQKSEIMGKSQLDLILLVYDGAISAFKAASRAYRENESNKGFEQLERAKRFVTHLYTTLDNEKGGEIAEQLGKLYAFVINQTNVIEGTKDLKLIDDNISVLNNLRQGWLGLKQQQSGQKEPEDKAQQQASLDLVTLA